MRVLVTGWFSFLHGEATAGDVLALEAVTAALARAGIEHEVAWSQGFRPGCRSLADAAPERYSDLVFVCGPLHGDQVRELHERYAPCRRIAVGVSVIDPADPAVTGFDLVIARDGATDGGGTPPTPRARRDLATGPAKVLRHRPSAVAVTGVILTRGQHEYGDRRRHEQVYERLTGFLGEQDCARVELDTRLDARDWRLSTTAEQLIAVLRRLDVIVTSRLHGLVLGLSCGVPVLAVDPVAGGGKVTEQARAWDWPGILTLPADADADAAGLEDEVLQDAWTWCLSAEAREAALDRSLEPPGGAAQGAPAPMISDLLNALYGSRSAGLAGALRGDGGV